MNKVWTEYEQCRKGKLNMYKVWTEYEQCRKMSKVLEKLPEQPNYTKRMKSDDLRKNLNKL